MPDDSDYRFGAFISYRHVEPDRELAKWLHATLEGYRIPSVLAKKPGVRPRVGRVFRDEEELSASADLSTAITEALDQSRYLIVVCSPRTPASEWVNQEVVRFRELKRDDRILALLIEGEPSEAFPRSLCEIRRTIVNPDGEVVERIDDIEPLAADVRPREGEKRRRTREFAKLRILATVLGCRFDDLRQREQERRFRRMILSAGVITAVLAVVAALGWQLHISRLRAAFASRVATTNETREYLMRADYYRQRGQLEDQLYWYTRAAVKGLPDDPQRAAAANLLASWSRRWRLSLLHDGPVLSAVYSNDGKTILTGDLDGTARLWDAETGIPRSEPLVHEYAVICVALSPDGKWQMTGTFDGRAFLWDTKTLQRRELTPGRGPGPVDVAAFSPDGSTVAIVFRRQESAQLWDVATGQRREAVLSHNHISAIAFSDDGTEILTGSSDGLLRRWDARTFEPRGDFVSCGIRINSLTLSPHGETALAVTLDKMTQLWDARNGQQRGNPMEQLEGAIVTTAFSPDGQRFATLSQEHVARLWDANTGKLRSDPIQNVGDATSLDFSRHNKVVLRRSESGSARIWDGQSGNSIKQGEQVSTVAVSPGGTTILTGSGDIRLSEGESRLWDPAVLVIRGEPFVHKASVNSVAFSPNGKRVLTGSDDGEAQLWDMQGVGQRGATLKHDGPVRAVAMSSDGKTAVTLSFDRSVAGGSYDPIGLSGNPPTLMRLWDVDTGTLRGVPHLLTKSVNTVAFSPDGKIVIMGSGTGQGGGEVQFWDIETGTIRAATLQHDEPVRSVAFSPDGKTVLTGSGIYDNHYLKVSGEARLWDSQTGLQRGEPLKHDGPVSAVAFSPDGSTALTGSYDKTVRLWDVKTGMPQGEPLRTGSVAAVAFSPNGRTFLSAGDETVLWDTQTRTPRGQPLKHTGSVRSASFSPDGRTFLIGSSDGTAQLFEVPAPACIDEERLRLSIEVRTGYTWNPVNGNKRRLSVEEWMKSRDELYAKHGGSCDVRTWEDLSRQEILSHSTTMTPFVP